MDRLISLFTFQWHTKLLALLIAFIVWFYVNKSITETKTIPNVPIRVINIPDDKTIVGILPNGILDKRINLTLSGAKRAVEGLESGDVQVLVDALVVDQDDWSLQITNRNLISLNPSVNLFKNISQIQHPDYIIKLSRLASAKVPVTVRAKGSPPEGYDYLDIWPQYLKHSVVGPEEQVQSLANTGLELTIDMSLISKIDLDKIKSSRENFHDDEVSFFIPNHWKKVNIPHRNSSEVINDIEVQNLHVDFLRKESLPLGRDIAINVFYPLKSLDKINPLTHPLIKNDQIKVTEGVSYLTLPLYIKDVSRLFVEIVRDSLELLIVAAPGITGDSLNWSLEVIDPKELELRYVTYLMANHSRSKNDEPRHTKRREMHLRERFRDYLQKLTLYSAPDTKFQVDVQLAEDGIKANPGLIKTL